MSPTRFHVMVNGIPCWRCGTTILPIMAGGAPDGEGEGGGESDGDGESQGTGANGKTFTQDEVNRLIGERVERERSKYKDYSTLKKSAEELAQLKQSQMTETEKLQNRLKELEGKEQTWQQERRELLLRGTIERTATTLGIVDPEAAYRLLDMSSLEFADDGTPKNVETALKALLKAKPYLGRPGGGSVDGGSGQGAPPGNDMNALLRRAAGRA